MSKIIGYIAVSGSGQPLLYDAGDDRFYYAGPYKTQAASVFADRKVLKRTLGRYTANAHNFGMFPDVADDAAASYIQPLRPA